MHITVLFQTRAKVGLRAVHPNKPPGQASNAAKTLYTGCLGPLSLLKPPGNHTGVLLGS